MGIHYAKDGCLLENILILKCIWYLRNNANGKEIRILRSYIHFQGTTARWLITAFGILSADEVNVTSCILSTGEVPVSRKGALQYTHVDLDEPSDCVMYNNASILMCGRVSWVNVSSPQYLHIPIGYTDVNNVARGNCGGFSAQWVLIYVADSGSTMALRLTGTWLFRTGFPESMFLVVKDPSHGHRGHLIYHVSISFCGGLRSSCTKRLFRMTCTSS